MGALLAGAMRVSIHSMLWGRQLHTVLRSTSDGDHVSNVHFLGKNVNRIEEGRTYGAPALLLDGISAMLSVGQRSETFPK